MIHPFEQTKAATFVALPCILGLLWANYDGYIQDEAAYKITRKNSNGKLQQVLMKQNHNDAADEAVISEIQRLSEVIKDGSKTFLRLEYQYISAYMAIFFLTLSYLVNIETAIAFLVGGITSLFCGWIGMMLATDSNGRTAYAAIWNLEESFHVALSTGALMGVTLCSMGVLNLLALYLVYTISAKFASMKEVTEALAGYGFGGSSVALFGRVGGGIFTKAADVGADLSGKNEFGLNEDDPRNPACIADNVGDNVGDVAGMGSDLFGSLAESTCAALVIAGASLGAVKNGNYVPGLSENSLTVLFPLSISSVGILVGILTLLVVRRLCPVKTITQIEPALKMVLFISTFFMTPIIVAVSYISLPVVFEVANFGVASRSSVIISILSGLWCGLLIGVVTEYYTSYRFRPVRSISESQLVSCATGIINGLAVGYKSAAIPSLAIGATITIAHQLAGMYGVAMGALGMCSTLSMCLAIDIYGPIADNAGGIAEMASLGDDVREKTDALDAAGNTTAAIGKGYAIGSAAMVSLALFGAFTVRANVAKVSLLDPWTFWGLIVGAGLPYLFSAMTMRAVGRSADMMVSECVSQFPAIIDGTAEPDYERCIAIATKTSLHEMVAPGALVILSPLVIGFCFGKNAVAGLLVGALISGIQLAISMANTGGAWDNAKKYIEKGGLEGIGRGTEAHKAAVTADTVGDPMKDTSGPSINVVIKLTAITALVFGSFLADSSNQSGGPWWF